MNTLSSVFLIFLVGYSECEQIELECDQTYSLTSDSLLHFDIHHPDKPDDCTVTVIPATSYIVPVISSSASNNYFYSVSISIHSEDTATATGGDYSFVDNGTLVWRPMAFTLTVSINDQKKGAAAMLELLIAGQNIYPPRISNLTVYDDGSVTFLDSEFLVPNRSAISLVHANNSTIQIRALHYPDSDLSYTDTTNLLLYSNGDFLCSANELLSNAVRYANGFTVFSINPSGKQGITFLAAVNYTFPGEVNVVALSQSNGPASDNPQIYHYVAPRGTNTVRYSSALTFIEAGNLKFYAGAVTGPKDNLLLEEVCEQDASLSAPLLVKGRGRTLILDKGNVIIDSDIYFQEKFNVVQAGQQGIMMSSNYPYSGGQAESDGIKLHGANNETFTYDVEVIAPGLKEDDYLTIGCKAPNGTNQVNSYSEAVQTSFQLTGSDLYLRYTIGARSDGMLIRYKGGW